MENIQQQIKDLNKLVLEYCVKNVLVNLKQYLGYLEDIQETTDFIPNPKRVLNNLLMFVFLIKLSNIFISV